MQCQKRGCDDTATHAMKLCCPRIGQSDDAVHLAVLLGVLLCEDHMDEAEPQDFLASARDVLGPVLNVASAGGNPPDFDRLYIVGVSVHSAEYMAMAMLAEKKPN